jgi:hypothetical protein
MEKKIRNEFSLAEAKVIGKRLGIDWKNFDVKQFRVGLNAELESGIYNPTTNFLTDDPILIGKVVRAHLNESPDYYTRWARMEKAAARKHAGKESKTDESQTDESQTDESQTDAD